MAASDPRHQPGPGTWVRSEPPPKNAGEPKSVRDAYDALKATGGRHR